MEIKIFSLFPEMFDGPLGSSLLGKARSKGILQIDMINFRDYSTNKHHAVDDYPFGGGAGMVLQPEPIISALRSNLNLHDPETEIILLSPQGAVFDQEAARQLSQKNSWPLSVAIMKDLTNAFAPLSPGNTLLAIMY